MHEDTVGIQLTIINVWIKNFVYLFVVLMPNSKIVDMFRVPLIYCYKYLKYVLGEIAWCLAFALQRCNYITKTIVLVVF